MKEQIEVNRQQSTLIGKSPNPFTHKNLHKHNLWSTMDDDMAETPRRTVNRAHEKKRIFDKVKGTKQESGIVLNGMAVTIQRLVLTSAETSSAKVGAAWCMWNKEESVYHIATKGYIMQTLQQHQETKYSKPQTHQSVG